MSTLRAYAIGVLVGALCGTVATTTVFLVVYPAESAELGKSHRRDE